MGMILNHYGCAVGQAENGQLAIDRLEEQDYDMVLMDMEMPVMNGIEAAKAIRNGECFKRFVNFRSIPIIALTGNTDQESIESSKQAGMNHYLSKPVFRDELVATIAKWVKNTIPSNETADGGHASEEACPDVWEAIGQENILDHSIINSLREIGGNELISTLFDVYIQDTAKIIDELEKAAQGGQIKNFGNLAHTLKGSSGSIGANRLFVLARHLNDCSRQQQWPDRTEWADITKTTFSRTVQEMQALRKSP